MSDFKKLPPADQWHLLPDSQESAEALGVRWYWDRKPCVKGHESPRYTSDKKCIKCRLERAKRYIRRRMKEETTEGYYAARNAAFRERYANDPALRARMKAASDKARERGEKRSTLWTLRTPLWVSRAERKEMRAFYRLCPKGYEVDHIVDLRGELICGLHVLANLQYLTPRQNRKKQKPVYTEEEALELIRDGLAVWTKDVGPDGFIDWEAYLNEFVK